MDTVSLPLSEAWENQYDLPHPKARVFSLIEPFRRLEPAELDALATIAISKSYEKGETLFHEGTPCVGIHVIAQGAVKILKTTPAGRQIVLAGERAPATVAEVPVFDGGDYPATVVAVQPTESLLILRADFHALCRRNPELPLRFLEIFGKRLRTLVNLVERITFGNLRQRLAQSLLDFAELAGANTFAMPETQEQLAVRLGTVREVVSRNLSRFQTEGLIRLVRRDVEIIDKQGLQAEANTAI